MAYYDQGYKVDAGYLPRIDTKNYLLSGMQSGQNLQKGALELQAGRNKMQQGAVLKELAPKIMAGDKAALTQAYQLDPTGKSFEGVLGQQKESKSAKDEFLARGSFDVLNAPKEMQQKVYEDFVRSGVASGHLPESMIGDTLDADDLEIMSQMVRRGQKFEDVAPTAEESRKAKLDERKFGLEEKKFNQEIKEYNDKLKQGNIDPKDKFDFEMKMRKEFTGLSGEFIKQRDSYSRVQASGENPSAAGDLALIFNYMKILDPGSVVRESEFATAAASGSYGERLEAAANKILKGERLSDEMRKDFLDRSDKLYNKAQKQHNKRVSEYTDLAKRSNIDPQQIILDLGQAEQAKTGLEGRLPDGTKANQDGTFTLPNGTVIRKKQ